LVTGSSDRPSLDHLQPLSSTAAGRDWLRRLPTLVEGCRDRWDLRLEAPSAGAQASLTMPASRPDGTPVVLKIAFPHRESEHEADALSAWHGEGAVQLLDRAEELHAMLLERCDPGLPLSSIGSEEALDVVTSLLPRLWIPVGAPFRTLATEAAWWASDLEDRFERAGKPFEGRLMEIALHSIEELLVSDEEPVLLHQDLHGDNVLRATREPWLVIDPKPLAGERAFSAAPIVRSHELGHSRNDVLRRLDRMSDDLGIDRERARRWSITQTIAWGFDDDGADPWHIAVATWLAEKL
jgi:streptomycin 6-kinase